MTHEKHVKERYDNTPFTVWFERYRNRIPNSFMKGYSWNILHQRASKICVILALLLMVGCSNSATSPEDPEPDITLDLQTLTAETEFGTLHAERAENSFVGPLDEHQAIGVAFIDEITSEDREPQEIVVFLYDSQGLALMMGEVNAEGAATLASDEFSDFGATVELVMEDESVTGTVTFMGESTPFTAEAASSIGGVYWAHGTDEDPDLSAYWVVLPDERQWGFFNFTGRDCPVFWPDCRNWEK